MDTHFYPPFNEKIVVRLPTIIIYHIHSKNCQSIFLFFQEMLTLDCPKEGIYMPNEKMSKKLQQAVQHANETNPSSRSGGNLPTNRDKMKNPK
jgi:hypothetical protein